MSRFFRIILSIVLGLFSSHSFSQNTQQETPQGYDFSSPYHTMEVYLDAMDEDSYQPKLAARAFQRKGVDENKALDVAIKLHQILVGRAVDIDLDHVSHDPNFKDSLTNEARYVLMSRFPKIYLEKNRGQWLFSIESIDRIEELHKETYPYGTDRLLNILPKIGNKRWLGLHTWQYVGILMLILVSLLVHKVFTFIFEYLILGIIHRMGYRDLAMRYVLPVARPFSIVAIFALLTLFVPVLQLPIGAAKYVILGMKALIPLFATIIFYRLVDILALYLQKLAGKTESTLDDQLIPLVSRTLKIFVIVIGTLFTLQNLDFDITAILAGISIGGLAFALAAQDTLKNFFGSVMIFIDKPFQIGHAITSGSEIDGVVEEVGFRSTRIRTFTNSVTSIPNGRLADAIVDNRGLRVYRRFNMHIGLTYDTPPHMIELFVEGLRKIVNDHPDTRKDLYEIHFNEMGDFSLKILFYIFFQVPGWSEELKARQEILLSIMRLANELGVRFAFPTQTLHMETMVGKGSMIPESFPPKELLQKKMDDFFDRSK